MGNPWYGLIPAVSYLIVFLPDPVVYCFPGVFKLAQGQRYPVWPWFDVGKLQRIFYARETNYLAYARSMMNLICFFFSWWSLFATSVIA